MFAWSVVVNREITLQDHEIFIYTSTTPCLICAGAIWSARITEILYYVSFLGFANWLDINFSNIFCEGIYRLLNKPAEIHGLLLESEGLKAYEYWSS